MVQKIDTHINDALSRVIEQYKCSEVMTSIITSLVEQIQIAEDSSFSLFNRLDILNSSGSNLDKIGEIVGLPRNGASDERYRLLLISKIGQNTSNGEPSKVISIYKLLSNSGNVHLQELYPAAISLTGDGDFNNSSPQEVYDVIQSIVAAGVRVDALISYDPECFFVFEGDPEGQGFADDNQTDGGCLATVLDTSKPFAFSGGGQDTDGFGSLNDSVIGGTLVSV